MLKRLFYSLCTFKIFKLGAHNKQYITLSYVMGGKFKYYKSVFLELDQTDRSDWFNWELDLNPIQLLLNNKKFNQTEKNQSRPAKPK